LLWFFFLGFNGFVIGLFPRAVGQFF